MTRSLKILPPKLESLTLRAKSLREWARYTTLQPPPSTQSSSSPISNTDLNFSAVAHERRRQHRRRHLTAVLHAHAALDAFFAHTGLPALPDKSPTASLWRQAIARLRERADRNKRTAHVPFSKNPHPHPHPSSVNAGNTVDVAHCDRDRLSKSAADGDNTDNAKTGNTNSTKDSSPSPSPGPSKHNKRHKEKGR